MKSKKPNSYTYYDKEQLELRKSQVLMRLEQITYELLYVIKFKEHQQIYAQENDKNISETTIEEVIESKGNIMINDVVTTYSKITEAFTGIEEKLAALVIHSPQTMHKYHDDLEKLKSEAEKSYKEFIII